MRSWIRHSDCSWRKVRVVRGNRGGYLVTLKRGNMGVWHCMNILAQAILAQAILAQGLKPTPPLPPSPTTPCGDPPGSRPRVRHHFQGCLGPQSQARRAAPFKGAPAPYPFVAPRKPHSHLPPWRLTPFTTPPNSPPPGDRTWRHCSTFRAPIPTAVVSPVPFATRPLQSPCCVQATLSGHPL